MNIYQKAIAAIRSHPYSFLYHPDFKAALQYLKSHNNDPHPSLSEGHPISAYDPRKIALLPVTLDTEDDRYYFNWQIPRDEQGPEFVSLMFDALEKLPISGVEDAKRVRTRYPHGTRIYAKPKDDYLTEGEFTVDYVDDAGQIHIKESGIALIPSVDEISYVCITCGDKFSYPPAQSRIDGKNVCRKCSAKEALDAAGIKDKDEILNIIR